MYGQIDAVHFFYNKSNFVSKFTNVFYLLLYLLILYDIINLENKIKYGGVNNGF